MFPSEFLGVGGLVLGYVVCLFYKSGLVTVHKYHGGAPSAVAFDVNVHGR